MPPLGGPGLSRMSRREVLLVSAGFAALTLVMTYPQALTLSSRVGSHYDALFSVWRLAWVAHQLPRDPAHLFDANIFYPQTRTLAYSDAIVLPAFLGAPFLWAGVPPVVVHNVLLLLSFVAAGVSMYALTREIAGSPIAAWFSGCVFAFQPFRFDHYSQIELLWSWPIPLAFLLFHRVERGRTVGSAAWLALVVACQVWSCVYYAVYLVTALGVLGVVLLWRSPFADVRRVTTRVALAIVLLVVLIAPYALQYMIAGRSVGIRAQSAVRGWSATVADYVTTPPGNRFYGAVLGRAYSVEHALFPGVVPLIAAIIGLWPPLDRRRIAYGVLLALAFDWSLGFNGATYPALYRWLWVYRGLRVPARMFTIAAAALAVLAGFGVARLLSWIGDSRRRFAAGLVAIGIVLLEYATAPSLVDAPRTPQTVYSRLAAQAPSVVAEWPMPRADALGITHEPVYMFYSIRHWQQLVNGYSGFYPSSYVQLLDHTATFPSAEAIEYLARMPVDFIVLHSEFDPAGYVDVSNALARNPNVELVLTERQDTHEIALYRLRR